MAHALHKPEAMNTKLLLGLSILASAAAMIALGCSAEGTGYDDAELQALDEELSSGEVVAAGVELRVTASALNFRSGPGTSYSILKVLDYNTKVVTVTSSGGNGWVNVKEPGGKIGWVSGKYVVRTGTSSGGTSTTTCAPSRGQGIVSSFQKALHDSIAWAEGTRNYSKDGYNVMFSFKTFSSCQYHPNQCIAYGSTCSTAAGRYQFLTSTWNGARSAKGLSSFEPENQERAASYLITNVRKVTVPQTRAMTATEFSNAMSKLSYEWASLPPGRYGQPTKTLSQMRSMYCGLTGC